MVRLNRTLNLKVDLLIVIGKIQVHDHTITIILEYLDPRSQRPMSYKFGAVIVNV